MKNSSPEENIGTISGSTLACGRAGGPVGRPFEEHDAVGVMVVRQPDQAPHHSVPGPRPDRDGEFFLE